MRTRVTRAPWFGPKRRLGWGWRPCSPAGWATVAAFAVALVVAGVLHAPAWAPIALVVALVVVVLLTGDPPG